jgi:glycosyltransferase involved in cell wall biosynthesis
VAHPSRDVAIYRPAAASFYESADGSGAAGGGAELQTVLLARALAERGLRVAHIIWPLQSPAPTREAGLTVIQRHSFDGDRKLIGKPAEAVHIWRAMAAADARVYVIRGGGPQLLIAALFCRTHRRELVFSASIDLDFDFDRPDRTRAHLVPYRAALDATASIVVQTEQQLRLAREVLPRHPRLVLIPSFVEPAERASAGPEGFLWVGRLVDYKRPLEFVKLAEGLPDSRFRMVYLQTTETSEALLGELRAAARRLPNLELLGQLPRGRVVDLMAGSFAVVSTSDFEGLPNVFLEAWARGVPVVSLEYDPDGRIAARGLGLVAGGSRERLVASTASLQHEPELRSKLGDNALAYIRDVHSREAVSARWAEVLGGP